MQYPNELGTLQFHFSIPKGLRRPALGCEERATQGYADRESTTLKGLSRFSLRSRMQPLQG